MNLVEWVAGDDGALRGEIVMFEGFFTATKTHIAHCEWMGGEIRSTPLYTFSKSRPFCGMAVCPHSKKLALSSREGTIDLFSFDETINGRFNDPTILYHRPGVRALQFHHHWLITVGVDCRCRFWDLNAKEECRRYQFQKPVQSIQILSDDAGAALASDGELFLWDLHEGEIVQKRKASEINGQATGLQLFHRASSQRILIATDAGRLISLDEKLDDIRSIQLHQDRFFIVGAFGRYIVTGGVNDRRLVVREESSTSPADFVELPHPIASVQGFGREHLFLACILQNGEAIIYQFDKGKLSFRSRTSDATIQAAGGYSSEWLYDNAQRVKRETVRTLLTQSRQALIERNFDSFENGVQNIHHLGYTNTALRLQVERSKAVGDSLDTLRHLWKLFQSMPHDCSEFRQCGIELLYALSKYFLLDRFQETLSTMQSQQPNIDAWIKERHPALTRFLKKTAQPISWMDTDITLQDLLRAVDIVRSSYRTRIVYKKLNEIVDPDGEVNLEEIVRETNRKKESPDSPAEFLLHTGDWYTVDSIDVRNVLVLESRDRKPCPEVGYAVWTQQTGGQTRINPFLFIDFQCIPNDARLQRIDSILTDSALLVWAASMDRQLMTVLRCLATQRMSSRKEFL